MSMRELINVRAVKFSKLFAFHQSFIYYLLFVCHRQRAGNNFRTLTYPQLCNQGGNGVQSLPHLIFLKYGPQELSKMLENIIKKGAFQHPCHH